VVVQRWAQIRNEGIKKSIQLFGVHMERRPHEGADRVYGGRPVAEDEQWVETKSPLSGVHARQNEETRHERLRGKKSR